MTFEPVFALYAAILGILAAYLTMSVILTRVRTGIESGDGGSEDMMRVLRAHGNFVEQAPMVLISLPPRSSPARATSSCTSWGSRCLSHGSRAPSLSTARSGRRT